MSGKQEAFFAFWTWYDIPAGCTLTLVEYKKIEEKDGEYFYDNDRQELKVELPIRKEADFSSLLKDLNWKMEGKRGLPPGRSLIPSVEVQGWE